MIVAPNNSNSYAPGAGVSYLQNPDICPKQFILQGASIDGAGTNQLFFGDSMGLAEALGLVSGAGAVEMSVVGPVTETNVKRYLQTYALIICKYNFESTNQLEINKNLTRINSAIDGDSAVKQLFSAQTVSNMQFNPNLLNVSQSFVWSHSTALKISIAPVVAPAPNITDTFTFSVFACVPYGQLNEFLAANPILDQNANVCR